jgi:hypothetical protein
MESDANRRRNRVGIESVPITIRNRLQIDVAVEARFGMVEMVKSFKGSAKD